MQFQCSLKVWVKKETPSHLTRHAEMLLVSLNNIVTDANSPQVNRCPKSSIKGTTSSFVHFEKNSSTFQTCDFQSVSNHPCSFLFQNHPFDVFFLSEPLFLGNLGRRGNDSKYRDVALLNRTPQKQQFTSSRSNGQVCQSRLVDFDPVC